MKFVVDTSALLSLRCSQYYPIIYQTNTIIVPPEVIGELKQFAQYNDFLGTKAQELLKQNFSIKTPTQLLPLTIEKTECVVFSLAKEKRYIALTDDIHAARIVYEKLKLKTKPSFYALILLYTQKVITKEQLMGDIQNIVTCRNWLNSTLWEYTRSLIKEL